jgi:hypothetical protein
MLPTIHGSASFQSAEDQQDDQKDEIVEVRTQNNFSLSKNGKQKMGESRQNMVLESGATTDSTIKDDIINNEDVPDWLKLYSLAPSNADHLLNFNLFKLNHLELFDSKLFFV